MDKGLAELKERLMEMSDLGGAASVLSWDQMTYMPPGGAAARARQMTRLQKMAFERMVDPGLGKLLKSLRLLEKKLDYESDDASLIRRTKIQYDLVTKIPTEFAEKLFKHGAESYEAWVKARPKNDFKAVAPYLEKTFDYMRQYSDFYPGYDHVMDPLVNMYDYGLKTKKVKGIFKELRSELVPLIKKIADCEQVDDSCISGKFPEGLQKTFGEAVAAKLGYDFKRGRLDKTPHPFTTSFSIGDVRITTRYNEKLLAESLFSTIHETGHALYEQGSDPKLEGLLSGGAATGIHESQSRLWENIVGRSRGFWNHFYPELRKTFPSQFKGVSLDEFYKAINKVTPSLIRTEADEVTYNIHPMIRFDLETALMEETLTVKELPGAWNGRYESDLGMTPPDYSAGVMQDVHWYHTLVGYFQGYTLGTIMSAQFYDKAVKAKPSIPKEIERGKFKTLHGWLNEGIYRHGSKFTTEELLKRNNIKAIEVEPFAKYLKKKYGEIYGF
ncbi:MAG: carboxypeptidase M32 [Methanobacteriota archaeon]